MAALLLCLHELTAVVISSPLIVFFRFGSQRCQEKRLRPNKDVMEETEVHFNDLEEIFQ